MWSSLSHSVVLIALASTLATACTGPVDVVFVNHCEVDIRLQTFDGDLNASGQWVADTTASIEVIVPAGQRMEVAEALQFISAPEEIRILEPVEVSYLISITDDLTREAKGPKSWTIPQEACGV